MKRLVKNVRKGARVLVDEGTLSLTIRLLKQIERRQADKGKDGKRSSKIGFISLVRRKDVMAADWISHPYDASAYVPRHTKVISWIVSPPSTGGGHQNIFRFIEFLDEAGYTNHVYLYSTTDFMKPAQAQKNVSRYCQAKNLHFHEYRDSVEQSDVVFATGWETAYAVFNLQTDALKYYFVQDFEPSFYPAGTNYLLAENTYRFGFHGITAGGWLKHKLGAEYGMACDSYDFGADKELYRLTNTEPRTEVFFYARPVTERRGFDLGLMALELFHAEMPNYTINLAGWDVSDWDVPFPHVNHKALKLTDLSEIYNRCAVGLVLSMTNMSLLPLELLACGAIPVVNDAPNNRLVSNNPSIGYVAPTPRALADAMIALVKRPDLPAYAQAGAASVAGSDWKTAGRIFVDLINKATSHE